MTLPISSLASSGWVALAAVASAAGAPASGAVASAAEGMRAAAFSRWQAPRAASAQAANSSGTGEHGEFMKGPGIGHGLLQVTPNADPIRSVPDPDRVFSPYLGALRQLATRAGSASHRRTPHAQQTAMERIERIHALHRILSAARYPVTVQRLQEDLECSRATVYRDLAYLRDYLMAPVVGNGEAGFRYDHNDDAQRFELPGLWLSSEELHALLAAQQLLVRSGGGVLSNALAPLQQRIEKLLDEHAGGRRLPVERVRVVPHRTRKLDETAFRAVATAVLDRKQLSFEYRARSTDERTRRSVSPQRLTHYRDNWYLDAWDHDRDALRSFSVDRITAAKVLDDAARDVAEDELDRHLASSYGIFSGTPKGWATILFSAKAARWVADEHWHSQQQGRYLPDGRYELKVPYSAGRELLMDVMHYGSDAEIAEPASLREQARSLLGLALSNYER